MAETLLKLNQVDAYYGGLQVLRNVSLNINSDEVVALMGPNGAGKSTVLKAIFGLLALHSGQMYWKEDRVIPVSHEIVQRGIAFVPQGRRVFTHLTVQENLEMGGYSLGNKVQLRQRLHELLELFPILAEKRNAKSGHLSGGQQQLLALARGLMTNPELLLLDEPTLGLSPKIVKEIFAVIKDIAERYHTAIIIVEHNIKSVLDIVDRAYILDHGAIVAQGSTEELLGRNVLEKVFMGQPLT